MDEEGSMAARRQPVLFVSHGAPTLAIDRERGAGLARLGRELARPSAVLVVSAHWERTPAALGTSRQLSLLHDYAGFPPQIARVRYDAPGAPELAARVADLLPGVAIEDERPWDHGVWVPLVHLLPAADVPLLQLSLPTRMEPAELLALGRAMAPLREEGVLLLASGGMVHNLRALDWSERSAPPGWALAFEGWARAALEARDLVAFAELRERAPELRRAHPTEEHLLPLLVAVGAGLEDARSLRYPVGGFEYGSLSRLAVELG
jgi:4,5-DOPA dioxygenase extradiol